ncbi:hypothetical protein [Chryseobacterium populi]|uniref:Uncharacterized protein n=1 Tax=Chryseobacterium populi TaxID=1144316 RepID=J2K8N0_9FLAO|nr:hypothetical protein [Chryseobacterium populi]EJL69568.1 hypothetical protein PMI13_03207 [Chryseobacterium populi]
MENRIFTCLFLLAGTLALAQVGVNTPDPQATLDVVAKNATGTARTAEGLLVPRVDRQRAQSMTGVTTSTLVYVNNIATGTAAGTAVNINTTGYYYFDGNVWVKVNSGPISDNNIYNTNGSLIGNRIVTQGKNTLTFNSDAVNGFSVDGSTFSVDAANNRVGIGTASPDKKLDVRSASAGAVRIQDGTQGDGYVLTSTADGTGIWKQPRAQVIRGATTGGYDFPFAVISEYRYTGASITLPPGKWLVTISQLIYPQGANLTANDWMFVRSTFSEQNLTATGQVGVQSADVNNMPTLMSFQVSGPYTQGQLRLDVKTGSVYINNSSNGNKTYRYIAGGTAVGGNVAGAYLKGLGGGWAENSLVATAIN